MKIPISFAIQRQWFRLASVVSPAAVSRWAASRFMATRRFPRSQAEMKVLAQGREIILSNGTAAWSWGKGKRVMLVHGWNGRGSQLFAFVTPLVDAGYEVIAWDGPAHGDSSGTRTNLGTFARTLVETELEVGTIEAVIAHSFGAAATVLASKMGFTANRLILIACPCSLQDVFDRFAALLLLPTKVSGKSQKIIEKEAGLRIEEAQVDRVGSSLSVKALLIHDLLDKEIPYGDAQRILSRWQGARLITTEGFGHRRILQTPDVIRHALSFLRESQAIP